MHYTKIWYPKCLTIGKALGLQNREWESNEIGQSSDGLYAGNSSQAEDVHSTCLTRKRGEQKKEEEGQYVVLRLICVPTLIKRRGLCSIDIKSKVQRGKPLAKFIFVFQMEAGNIKHTMLWEKLGQKAVWDSNNRVLLLLTPSREDCRTRRGQAVCEQVSMPRGNSGTAPKDPGWPRSPGQRTLTAPRPRCLQPRSQELIQLSASSSLPACFSFSGCFSARLAHRSGSGSTLSSSAR